MDYFIISIHLTTYLTFEENYKPAQSVKFKINLNSNKTKKEKLSVYQSSTHCKCPYSGSFVWFQTKTPSLLWASFKTILLVRIKLYNRK